MSTIDKILEDALKEARKLCNVVSVQPTTPLKVAGLVPIVEPYIRDWLCLALDRRILSRFRAKTLLVKASNEFPTTTIDIQLVMNTPTWARSVLRRHGTEMDKLRDRLMWSSSHSSYGPVKKLSRDLRSHISGRWSGLLLGFGPTGAQYGSGRGGSL